MTSKQAARLVKPSKPPQPLPHRQQAAVQRASIAPTPTEISYNQSKTASDSEESDFSDVSKTSRASRESGASTSSEQLSSRIGTTKLPETEELPRKCLVVRRSAPKKGVTKTEIRLVIYNETKKKDGLRKMEYPALMDATEMLADRLRDLETKKNKDQYEKDKEIRRQLESERRPSPTPDQEKQAVAKLKKAAPSMCNRSNPATDSEVTTAEPIDNHKGTAKVLPSKKPRRDRNAKDTEAKPIVEEPSTRTASEISPPKSTVSTVTSCPEKDCCMQQPCSKDKGRKEPPVAASAGRNKKKRRSKEKKQPEPDQSAPRAPEAKKEPVKEKPPMVLARIRDSSEDSSVSSFRKKPVKKTMEPSDEPQLKTAKQIRKPSPHAIREKPEKRNRPPKPEPKSEETVEPDEPKVPKKKRDVEPSEPRVPKKVRPPEPMEPEEPKESKRAKKPKEPQEPVAPKEPEVPKESKRAKKPKEPVMPVVPEEPKEPKKPKEKDLLCDVTDCCMQQPCVKKDRTVAKPKPKVESETEQPSDASKKKPKKKEEKKRKKVDVVIDDQTATTRNDQVEESLYVLKRIYKKLDSGKPVKLRNEEDVEYVKAKILKVIKLIEDKLATGEKLKSKDLEGLKNIVAMTSELRRGNNISLSTTVTFTETVSVEDEDTN